MWFRVATVLLILWGLAGCVACLQQIRLGADAMRHATAYDRTLYAGLPGWYDPLFAVAVLTGLVGAVLLFMRRATSRPFLIGSLVASAVQFGWLFTTTDIVAHKGAAAVLPFPAVIVAIALFAIWLAAHGRRRSWTV